MEPYILQITMQISKTKRRSFIYRFETKEQRDSAFDILQKGSCLSFPFYRKLTDEAALEAAKEK
jgi:hypothetical protein